MQKSYTIKPKGTRIEGNYGPENVNFSRLMTRLKIELGLKQRVGEVYENSRLDDYFFFLGISGEGFGLKYRITDTLGKTPEGIQALDDCFRVEGIKYRYVTELTENFREQIVSHINSDLPVLFLNPGRKVFAVNGYDDFGKTFYFDSDTKDPVPFVDDSYYEEKKRQGIAWNAGDPVFKIPKVLIFIDGLSEPGNKREIILSALKRGYGMLTEKGRSYGEYGYGNHSYEKWLKRYENEARLDVELKELASMAPKIKFDLAERRCYLVWFMRQCEFELGKNVLKTAFDSFNEIHELMWEIHRCVSDIIDKYATRDMVIEIIHKARELDLKAAKNIKQVLGDYKIFV